MLKHTIVFVFIILSSMTYSQMSESNIEEVTEFHSLLIDYEIYDDNIVAITKNKREYFIHFTNLKGEEAKETLEIHNPNDLEIDAKGNLYIIGLDQVLHIRITDRIEIINAVELESYNENIKNRVAYFDESEVKTLSKTELFLQPKDRALNKLNSEPFVISFHSEYQLVDSDQIDLEADSPLRVENAGNSLPLPHGNGLNQKLNHWNSTTEELDEIVAFKSEDSLWIFNKSTNTLFIYGPEGDVGSINSFETEQMDYILNQDKSTKKVYINYSYSVTYSIDEVDRFGNTETVFSFRKDSSMTDFKISNGYLYYKDWRSTSSHIKRVKLN